MTDPADTGPTPPGGPPVQDWRYATRRGARSAMLERTRTLTVRQRLEEMQALNELAAALRTLGRRATRR